MAEISKLNGYDIKDKKAIRYYDSVNDMKSDTTLKVGMCVSTEGYYSLNDGGKATYVITDTSSLTEYQEELENGLYGTLLVEDFINVKQFGAYGDGTHDDSSVIQKVVDYIDSKRIKIYVADKNNKGNHEFSSQPTIIFPFGTYKINYAINMSNYGYYLDGNNSYIISDQSNDIFYFSGTGGHRAIIKNFIFKETYNAIHFDCDNLDASKVTIEHCNFLGIKNVAIDYLNRSCMLNIKNCFFRWCYKIFINNSCDNVCFDNCWFSEFEASEDDYCSFLLLWGETKFINCFFIPNGNYNSDITQSSYSNLCWIQMGNLDTPPVNNVKVYLDKCRASAEANAKAMINFKCVPNTGTSRVTDTSIIITNCNALSNDLGTYIVKLWHLPQQLIFKNNKIGTESNTFVVLDSSLDVDTELATYYHFVERMFYNFDYSFVDNNSQTATTYNNIPSEIAQFVRNTDFDVRLPFVNNKITFNLGYVANGVNNFYKKMYLVKLFYNARDNQSGLCSIMGVLSFNTNSNNGTQITVSFTKLVENLGGPGSTPTITPTFQATGTNSILMSSGNTDMKVDLEISGTIYEGTPSFGVIKLI